MAAPEAHGARYPQTGLEAVFIAVSILNPSRSTVPARAALPTRAVIRITRDPLRRVAGLPLLARTVLALAGAGLQRIQVLTPLPASHLAPALNEIRRRCPQLALTLHTGFEPLAAGGPCLWLHTDGVWTEEALGALRHRPPGLSCPAPGDRPVGVTTGEAPEALRARLEAPCPAGASTPGYHPIRGRADLAGAEAMLFGALGKPSDGLVSRLFNRPLSTRLSRRLARHPVHPGQLTTLTAGCGLAMFAAFLTGGEYAVLAGCLLFHLASVADGLDGEIARIKFLSSPAGAAWDTAVDMATNLLFLVGLMAALYAREGELYLYLGFYLVGVAAAAMGLMVLLLRLGPGGGSFDVLGRALRLRLAPRPRLQRLFARVETCFKRDCYALLAALLALAGQATALPWLLAAGLSVWLLAILINAPFLLNAPAGTLQPAHGRAGTRP